MEPNPKAKVEFGMSPREVREVLAERAGVDLHQPFAKLAREAVLIVMDRGVPFTTDAVWEVLHSWGVNAKEPRVLGNVMHALEHEGWIRKTGQNVPSHNRVSHNRPKEEWIRA